MSKAVVIRRTGGAEQLRVEDIKDAPPLEGQVQIVSSGKELLKKNN